MNCVDERAKYGKQVGLIFVIDSSSPLKVIPKNSRYDSVSWQTHMQFFNDNLPREPTVSLAAWSAMYYSQSMFRPQLWN